MENNEFYIARLLSALGLHQLYLDEELESELRENCPTNPPRIQTQPLVHFALGLGKNWSKALKVPAHAHYACWLLSRLYSQQGYYQNSAGKARAYDQLSLVCRRLWLLAFNDPAWTRIEVREQRLRQEARLPEPSLYATTPQMKAVSRATANSFLFWARQLELDLRPFAQREDSDLLADEHGRRNLVLVGDEVVSKSKTLGLELRIDGTDYTGKKAHALHENSAFTRMHAAATCLEPVAFRWFADLRACKIENESPQYLRFALLWQLEMFYGISTPDALNLGLRGNLTKLGMLSPTTLILGINTGYFSSARCWDSDQLDLRVVPELARVLELLLKRFPNAKRVSDFRAGNESLIDAHKHTAENVIRKYLPGWKTKANRIDKVFLRTALLACDLPASLVGLLRARPVCGARGQSSYLSVPLATVKEASERIFASIYAHAGVPFVSVPITAENPDHLLRLLGTRAMTLGEFAAITHRLIEKAEAPNELVACVVRLFRGLGLRKRDIHLNPVRMFRTDIVPLLEVRDKRAGEWVPTRYPVLTSDFVKLIEQIGLTFGDQEFLTYDHQDECMVFADLPESERKRLDRILRDEGHYNAGRTGLFNALVERHAGDVIRQVLLGHGSIITHLAGCHLPVPPEKILQAAQDFMVSICRDEGLDDCARALTQRLRKIDPATRKLDHEAAPRPSTKTQVAMAIIPKSVEPPLEWEEVQLRREVYRQIDNRPCLSSYQKNLAVRKSNKVWPTHGAAAMGLISLQLGVPLRLLQRFQRYISYGSVVLDPVAKCYYLIVSGPHHDAGGLAQLPIRICSSEEAADNPVLRLIRYRYDRAVKRLSERSKTPDPAVEVLSQPLFGIQHLTIKEIGKDSAFILPRDVWRRLRRRPGEAFTLLDRMSKTTCSLRHSPLVAGWLSRRSLLGLNHFSVQDVIDAKNGATTELQTLAGTTWQEARTTMWSQKTKPLGGPPNPSDATIADWKEYFCPDTFTAPRWATVRDELISAGMEAARAMGVATKILGDLLLEGRGGTGRPLPLLSEEELNEVIAAADRELLTLFKPRKSRRLSTFEQLAPTVIRKELILFSHILHRFLLRPAEARNAYFEDVLVVAGWVYFFIRAGKTDNALRIVRVRADLIGDLLDEQLSSAPGAREKLGPWLLRGLRFHHRSHESSTAALRARLRSAGKPTLTPYDLRHIGLVHLVQREIQERLQHGNFTHALAYHAVSVGHGSLAVTLYTYVGTAAFVFT